MTPGNPCRCGAPTLLALGYLFAANPALADEFHYKGILAGERAAGLGGAYIALADDHTSIVYNPAGLISAEDGSSSASVNVISAASTQYDRVFGDTEWSRESLEILPGFAGGAKAFGDLMLGATLLVSDSLAEDQTQNYEDVRIAGTRYDRLRIHNDLQLRSYEAGLAVGMRLSPNWQVGMSLLGSYVDKNNSYVQRAAIRDRDGVTDAQVLQVTVNSDDTRIGLRPILGLQFRWRALALGATVSQNLPLSRDYQYAYSASLSATSLSGGNTSFEIVDLSEQTEDEPLRASFGLALKMTASTVVSAQLDYFSERNAENRDLPFGAPPRSLDNKAVTNLSLGLEWQHDTNWTSRFGLFSDYANNSTDYINDELSERSFARREEIDIFGLTYSVTRQRASGNHLAVGLLVAAGSGTARLGDVGFGSDVGAEIDAKQQRLNFFFTAGW